MDMYFFWKNSFELSPSTGSTQDQRVSIGFFKKKSDIS